MNAHIGWPAIVRQAVEIAGRRGHDVLIMLLLLGALAMIAAVAWLTEHMTVFAGIALLMWGVVYLGRREQTRERRGSDPAAPGPARGARSRLGIASGHVALADYGQEELIDERPIRQVDRTRLLADPLRRSPAQAAGAASPEVTIDMVIRAEGGMVGIPRETLDLVVLEGLRQLGLNEVEVDTQGDG